MLIPKVARYRSEAHRRWVAAQPCVICEKGRPTDRARMLGEAVSCAHHITIAPGKGRGVKPSDEYTAPLCVMHHDPNSPASVHYRGDERAWWAGHGLDPLAIAERLWGASIKAGRVCAPARSRDAA